MKYLIIVTIILSSLLNKNLKAQDLPNITPLKVGEKVPDLFFDQLVNYDNKSLKLSDVKGKLTIIDIWNKSCSACISAFPKMEKLQQQFPGQINVLLVTEDSREEFNQLKSRSMIVTATKLPIVLGSKVIRKLFPSTFVPLHVWIDSTLTVVAITSGSNTTSENIANYLKSGTVNTNIQNKSYTDFNTRESLLNEGKGRHLPSSASYSVFFNELVLVPKAGGGNMFDSITGKVMGHKALNKGLSGMVSSTFIKDRYHRIIYEFTEDKGRIIQSINSSYDFIHNEKKYSYELKLPETKWGLEDAVYEYMKEDLKRFFQLDFKVEQRKVRRITLAWIGDKTDLDLQSLNNQRIQKKFVLERLGDTLYAQNVSINPLINAIKNYFVFPRIQEDILVESAINNNSFFDLKVVLKGNSIADWNKELAKYGLKLEDGYITDNFLIVRGGPESYKMVFKEGM